MSFNIKGLLVLMFFVVACSSDDSISLQQVSATSAVLKQKLGSTYPRVSDDTHDVETYNLSAVSLIEIENYNENYTYKLNFKGQQFGSVYQAAEEKEEQDSGEFKDRATIKKLTVSTTINTSVIKFDLDHLNMDVDFYEVTLLEVESNHVIPVGNYVGNTKEYRLVDSNQTKLATTIAIQLPGDSSFKTQIVENQNFHLNFIGRNQVRLYKNNNETPYLVFLSSEDKTLVKETEVFYSYTYFDNSENKHYYSYDLMDSPSALGVKKGKYWIRLEIKNSSNQTISQSPLIPLEISSNTIQ